MAIIEISTCTGCKSYIKETNECLNPKCPKCPKCGQRETDDIIVGTSPGSMDIYIYKGVKRRNASIV